MTLMHVDNGDIYPCGLSHEAFFRSTLILFAFLGIFDLLSGYMTMCVLLICIILYKTHHDERVLIY